MKLNVGGIDRMARIVVGIVLIALAYPLLGILGWWGWIGIIPLVTGLFSFCPFYTLLGINTCPVKKS